MDDSAIAYGAQAALLDALDGLLGPRAGSSSVSSAGRVAAAVSTGAVSSGAVSTRADAGVVDGVLASWSAAPFLVGAVSGWSADQARAGLAALERVERSIAAVRAALVCRAGLNRDSAAALSRSTGMSQRAAREAVRVAETVAGVPGVGERLAAGEVSAGQVGAVAGLGPEDAAELLDVAAGQSDDEFARVVQRFKVEAGGRDRAQRQRAARSVRFGEGPDGCMRITAVLPPLEGAEVRGVLDHLCDAAWRRDHPERARTAGGHEGEPRDRRLADALVALVRGYRGLGGPAAAPAPGPASGPASTMRASDANGYADTDEAGSVRWSHPTGSGSGWSPSMPAVIVTVDAETLRTTLLPDTALDPSVLPELLPRSQLYAAIRDGTDPAKMVFGRNRRLASPLQRLALAVLQPRCDAEGCDVPAQRCEVHHVVEFDAGGCSDLCNYKNYCLKHHHHHHDQEAPTGSP